jgi:hypothetical protein
MEGDGGFSNIPARNCWFVLSQMLSVDEPWGCRMFFSSVPLRMRLRLGFSNVFGFEELAEGSVGSISCLPSDFARQFFQSFDYRTSRFFTRRIISTLALHKTRLNESQARV